jgi:hypothetical protein
VEGEQKWNIQHPKGFWEGWPLATHHNSTTWAWVTQYPPVHHPKISRFGILCMGWSVPRGSVYLVSTFFFLRHFFLGSSLFFLPCSLWFYLFFLPPLTPFFFFGTPTYPSNLPTTLPPTSPSTSLIVLTPLLCLRSPPLPTLEIQWDHALRL